MGCPGAPSESIALVHQEDDTINGFVCGHDVGFRAYLSALVVSPASQLRGVGSRLIAELERRLSDPLGQVAPVPAVLSCDALG